MNIDRLSSTLSEGEGYFISSPENRFYFTEFPSTDGWLIVSQKESVFLTDSRYIEAAQAKAKGCTEVLGSEDILEQMVPLCARLGINHLFVETGRITLGFYNRLCEKLSAVEVTGTERLGDEIDKLRAVKCREEVDCIIRAQRIAEKAFEQILPMVKPGKTEKELARELNYAMMLNGADDISFETIAISGVKTSMPHGVPGDRKVGNGEFVTFDFGALVNGYHSDMTRTVAVGSISDKMAEVYNTVLKAQQASLNYIGPGKLCRQGDLAARNVIKKAGYGEYFGHSTGHGVGVEIHEMPRLSQRCKEEVLVPGNVVTVEPGIYLPGCFGVRIEDMVCITENGFDNLTNCPKELIIL